MTIFNKWVNYGNKVSYYIVSQLVTGNAEKIAAFDIDWTIIRTKSGRVFPKDKNDWELWNSSVVRKIREFKEKNYKIVLFSNQSKNLSDLKIKFRNICKALDGDNPSISMFISTQSGYYRKPNTGMWVLMIKKIIGKTKLNTINLENSFYCGDAAGRKAGCIIGNKKDFSNSDFCFAKNIGIKFYTPEEMFDNKTLHHPLQYNRPNFDALDIQNINIDKSKRNLVLLIGKPASGKSLIANYLKKKYGFIILSQDIEKTRKKMEKRLIRLIDDNNVIIDSQNYNRQSRKNYIDIARSNFNSNKPGSKLIITVINIIISDEMAEYLNKFRVQITKGKTQHISRIVYSIFNKKYEPPTTYENIDIIINTTFCKNLLNIDFQRLLERYYF